MKEKTIFEKNLGYGEWLKVTKNNENYYFYYKDKDNPFFVYHKDVLLTHIYLDRLRDLFPKNIGFHLQENLTQIVYILGILIKVEENKPSSMLEICFLPYELRKKVIKKIGKNKFFYKLKNEVL